MHNIDNKRLNEKFKDFDKAINRLKEAIDESNENPQSTTLKDGVIQRFEFTYELCWKLIKYFLEMEGIEEAKSPRSTFREAFQYGLIDDGEQWIDMLKDRNITPYTYDEKLVSKIYDKIKNEYYNMFVNIKEIIIKNKNIRYTLNN